jgi:hypothetical protein
MRNFLNVPRYKDGGFLSRGVWWGGGGVAFAEKSEYAPWITLAAFMREPKPFGAPCFYSLLSAVCRPLLKPRRASCPSPCLSDSLFGFIGRNSFPSTRIDPRETAGISHRSNKRIGLNVGPARHNNESRTHSRNIL